jgi:hypothetical protein
LIIDAFADPLHTVFWLLLVAFMIALVTMPLLPEVVTRSPGWLSSLKPQIAVKREARRSFVTSTPSMVAIWAVGGLYVALGPSVAISLLDSASHLAGGAMIATLLGTAAAASLVSASADPRRMLELGSVLLAVGVGLTLAAAAIGSFVGLLVGSAVAGLGFGPAFSAILRMVAPLAPPNHRGALLAALYIEVYLSFSLPTIAAGYAAGWLGLLPTTYVYGAVVIGLALATVVLLRLQRST